MDAGAKQQIVDRLKQANNILVTVSNNPSVDQLAACIGATLMLNKIQKHATAVFSGQVPSTLEFLQPEKTIEKNTDSLRDFIISLDKTKADKLRYKVEDEVVKIYITPYRTKISEEDLIFEEGDFNVEVVLALGVTDRAQIDAAITAHGRILHDATLISINTGETKPTNMGQINWQDAGASSLCEMIVSISEAFGTGLIDNQMATAFLTGIVAETHRFSNDRTSPRVMTMSAQLMAAGANQQLIVTKLEEPVKPPKAPLASGLKKAVSEAKKPAEPGVLTIDHPKTEKPSEVPPALNLPPMPPVIKIDAKGNIVATEAPKPAAKPAPKPAAPASPTPKPPAPPKPVTPPAPKPPTPPIMPPTPPVTPPAPPTPPTPPAPPTPPPPTAYATPSATATAPAVPAAPTAAAPASPATGRGYLDPKTTAAPASVGAFSAISSPPAAPVLGGVDASAPAGPGPGASLYDAAPSTATATLPTVDSARDAVANAISSAPATIPTPEPAAPAAPAPSKEVAINIQPPAPAPPSSDTPSLQLPVNGSSPPPRPSDNKENPPPPGPPPLMPTGGNA